MRCEVLSRGDREVSNRASVNQVDNGSIGTVSGS